MNFNENPGAQITFSNEPKLSDEPADQAFNERRMHLLPQVKEFIAKHALFENLNVDITIAHTGISSLVCILETEQDKKVLKISLSENYALGEAQFLQHWEQNQVSVPHVTETGMIDGHQYTLMEHVDAPILGEAHTSKELIEKGTYHEMGETLQTMHAAAGEGYGGIVNERGKHAAFTDWIDSPDMKKQIEHVAKHDLLGEEFGAFDTIREILVDHVEKHPDSCYCHDDFHIYNIFDTEPLTVFDPNPRFNNNYIDLGRSIMINIAGVLDSKSTSEPVEMTQFLAGYFEGNEYNKQVLHASITLACYMKFPYWHKIIAKRGEAMRNMQTYLKQNKNRLD